MLTPAPGGSAPADAGNGPGKDFAAPARILIPGCKGIAKPLRFRPPPRGAVRDDQIRHATPKTDKVLAAPAYPFIEAAHYLNLPLSTLRAWCLGQPLHITSKSRRFQPLIHLDGDQSRALSFLNLIEAHVLAAIRRQHHVSLPSVRRALDFVEQRLKTSRPLAQLQFQTDGVDLFVERLGALINVTREGQTEMAEVLREHLKRIERDTKGVPVRLFLMTRSGSPGEQPTSVVIDPRIAFGRPVLVGRSVPTAVLADRFKAGDTFEQLAADYDTSRQAIEEALRCELDRKAA